ncbi:MAG: hypothetical protein AAGH79_07925 [Bacteroidota bacterium]
MGRAILLFLALICFQLFLLGLFVRLLRMKTRSQRTVWVLLRAHVATTVRRALAWRSVQETNYLLSSICLVFVMGLLPGLYLSYFNPDGDLNLARYLFVFVVIVRFPVYLIFYMIRVKERYEHEPTEISLLNVVSITAFVIGILDAFRFLG